MSPARRHAAGGRVVLVAGLCLAAWAFSGRNFVAPPQQPSSRRELVAGGLGAAVAAALGAPAAKAYELPPLPYAYEALEPSIDKETMTIHHDKHHATYIAGINGATEGEDQPPLLDLVKGAIKSGKRPYRNAGGGVWNHDFFWLEMAPTGTGGEPSDKLKAAVDKAFGSMEGLKEKFDTGAAPAALFGSGWAWVVVNKDGELEFTTTANQDNPLMEGVDAVEGIPILGLDVWEHAYYLKYQNRRPDYIKAWWDVVNWKQVSQWYEDALEGKAPVVDAPAAAAALVGRRPQAASPKFSAKFKLETGVQFG